LQKPPLPSEQARLQQAWGWPQIWGTPPSLDRHPHLPLTHPAQHSESWVQVAPAGRQQWQS
jgi:hypothetical protein